ncbi:MAG: asparagine synthase C-terminal domain-containing protein, partial [Pseudomonadota bacterium]
LPDDILVKVDRASMAVALEVRVPVLDHRVVEFAASLPTGMKIRNGYGKWIFKKLLSKYVSSQLTERPKKGFGVPVGTWLRGPLREWASDLLNDKSVVERGLIDSLKVTTLWNDHISLRRDWSYRLWGVLMLQSWLKG